MIVKQLTTKEIQTEWPVIEGYIDIALVESACDEYDTSDLKKLLDAGRLTLFAGLENDKIQGIIVISFLQYPKQKVAFICAYGGRLVTNKYAYKQLCLLFKDHGATKVQGYVRKSLARLTHRLGFVDKQTLIEHKL